MTLGRFVRAARMDAIPPGSGKAVRVEGRWFALFHDPVRGFFATDDACPHQGASLGEGILHEGTVICPWHAWSFSLRTGVSPHVPELAVACYPTRLEGDAVEVELPEETG